jgi:hypothetical protein
MTSTCGSARTRARTRASRSGRLGCSASSPDGPDCSPEALEHVASRGPECDQLCGEAVEEPLQGSLAPGEQPVDVPRLGHSATVRHGVGKLVPLDHHYLGVRVGKHAGSQQTCHAAAEHHRSVSTGIVHVDLLGPGVCR